MRYLLVVASVLTFAYPALAIAHPHHVCIGEVSIRHGEPDVIEVAILAPSLSLRRALGEKKMTDENLSRYLRSRFQLRDPDGKPICMTWVGHELAKPTNGAGRWLYLTFKTSAPLGELEVRNNLFMEFEDDQTNTLLVKDGRRKWSITFTVGRSSHPLFPKPSS